jgi:hypothetical protein
MISDSVYDALSSFLASARIRRGTHALEFNALRKFHDASHSFIYVLIGHIDLDYSHLLSATNSHAL